MRTAKVYVMGQFAGVLEEVEPRKQYRFVYRPDYVGPPVSLTMPTSAATYEFNKFPPFFDGVLPEGMMLEGLLRQRKLDVHDCFGQLMAVGGDLVGAVTVQEVGS